MEYLWDNDSIVSDLPIYYCHHGECLGNKSYVHSIQWRFLFMVGIVGVWGVYVIALSVAASLRVTP